jgi:hypothetical protein
MIKALKWQVSKKLSPNIGTLSKVCFIVLQNGKGFHVPVLVPTQTRLNCVGFSRYGSRKSTVTEKAEVRYLVL